MESEIVTFYKEHIEPYEDESSKPLYDKILSKSHPRAYSKLNFLCNNKAACKVVILRGLVFYSDYWEVEQSRKQSRRRKDKTAHEQERRRKQKYEKEIRKTLKNVIYDNPDLDSEQLKNIAREKLPAPIDIKKPITDKKPGKENKVFNDLITGIFNVSKNFTGFKDNKIHQNFADLLNFLGFQKSTGASYNRKDIYRMIKQSLQ